MGTNIHLNNIVLSNFKKNCREKSRATKFPSKTEEQNPDPKNTNQIRNTALVVIVKFCLPRRTALSGTWTGMTQTGPVVH